MPIFIKIFTETNIFLDKAAKWVMLVYEMCYTNKSALRKAWHGKTFNDQCKTFNKNSVKYQCTPNTEVPYYAEKMLFQET